MLTRTKITLYPEIDFDEATREWRANKKTKPNGCYEYICGHITKTGNKCQKKPCKDGVGDGKRCSLPLSICYKVYNITKIEKVLQFYFIR